MIGVITMKDIARRAGVSVVTVSRVLNGKYPNKVSDETRRRVLQIVEELGYRPNISARALRERRTYQIALVTPSIDSSFIAEVVQGIQDVAMDLGCSCLVYVTKSQPALERRIFQAILGKNVDGVIWLPGPTREKEVDRAARALPVIQILYKEVTTCRPSSWTKRTAPTSPRSTSSASGTAGSETLRATTGTAGSGFPNITRL